MVSVAGVKLRPATFRTSTELEVRDVVLAPGNPLGLRSSVTNGIVSALGRTVTEPGASTLPNVIQTSASINPGNSGGALIDLSESAVGIPTLAAVDRELGGSAAPGIGFAIPGDTAEDIAGQIIAHGHIVNSHRAYLGVRLATGAGAAGAVVAAVEPDGPADNASLRPGDTTVAIAGHDTPSPAEVAVVLAQFAPATTVAVVTRHQDATTTTVQVPRGQFPTNA